jgi:excisionase family DNA binding protein
MEELVTVQEVALYLKMNPQTIYRFAQQGRIPALKVGSRWRFRPADIEAWLQQQDDLAPHILVADDELAIGRFFKDVLEDRGYRVTVALDGTEAVACVNRQHYPLIFLDLLMPGMNGLEALQAIRKIDGEAKIVIVTGYHDSPLLEQILQLGPFIVLPKPFDASQLLNTVGMLLPEHIATLKVK